MKFDRKILAVILTVGLLSILAIAATLTWLSVEKEVPWTIEVKTADITVTPEELPTMKLAPGESTPFEITVENTGDVTLTVTLSPEVDGSVSFDYAPNPFVLAPGVTNAATVTITATLDTGYTESGGELSGTIMVDAEQTH